MCLPIARRCKIYYITNGECPAITVNDECRVSQSNMAANNNVIWLVSIADPDCLTPHRIYPLNPVGNVPSS